jgi:hypothetical protein
MGMNVTSFLRTQASGKEFPITVATQELFRNGFLANSITPQLKARFRF